MIEPVLAKRIQLVGIDVDGTMTDGGIYLGAAANTLGAMQPVELKRFDIQDGIGMVLLKAAGMVVVMSTGRPGDAARLRAQELGVEAFLMEPSARKLSFPTDAVGQTAAVFAALALKVRASWIQVPVAVRLLWPNGRMYWKSTAAST